MKRFVPLGFGLGIFVVRIGIFYLIQMFLAPATLLLLACPEVMVYGLNNQFLEKRDPHL